MSELNRFHEEEDIYNRDNDNLTLCMLYFIYSCLVVLEV